MGEPTTEALQQELKPKTNASKSKDHRGGKPPNRDVLISKALSKLLRHDAEKHKLKLDEEGYAPVEKVVGSDHFTARYFKTGNIPANH